MELPQEVELWYIVPSLRKALVTELKKLNLKQNEIAPLLGITESAISQYMKDKRASGRYRSFEIEPLRSEIEKSAKKISSQSKSDPAVAMREITRLCRIIKERKIICEIHRKQNPKVKSCDICY